MSLSLNIKSWLSFRSIPRKREPGPPRRWHRKIRRMRRGRDLPITDIVGYENEHVCEQPWRNSLLRSTSAPDSPRPARAASRMDRTKRGLPYLRVVRVALRRTARPFSIKRTQVGCLIKTHDISPLKTGPGTPHTYIHAYEYDH